MNQTTHQIFNLNLSPRYAPEWGQWEIAREFVCNAVDASPDGYKVETPTEGRITVWTPTVPSLAEMFMIGAGTKAPGDSTIGQFGEGSKLAALVATRNVGWGVEITTPEHFITFAIEPGIGGEPCLHAHVTEVASSNPGMTIDIHAPGIGSSIMGKFLFGQDEGPMPKSDPAKMQLYVKGVWIGPVEQPSIYDWNLNNVKINRDRTMATTHEIGWTIHQWIEAHMTDELAEILVQHQKHGADLIELYGIKYVYERKVTDMLVKAFMKVYGEKAIMAIDDTHANMRAQEKGYALIYGINEDLAKPLMLGGVQNSRQVLGEWTPEPVSIEPYTGRITWLRKLDDTTGIDGFSVYVMKTNDANLQGLADRNENRLWLSESLFKQGNEFELVRTYLHEVAHFATSGMDGTRTFEQGLDFIAAKLAMELL